MVSKSKKIGSKYLVELKTYPMAGGSITIWEKGESRLPHIWKNNADNTMHALDEVNFMYADNAIEEYRGITNFKTMVDLMRRNS